MRFNVTFGIMLGLALVELLLLQVAVLVDGHVITPPPALPTAMTGAGNPILAKRENTAFCDVAGAWKCGDGFYCFRSDDYLGCCPTSQRCIPHTRCINGDDLESATQNDDDLKSCVDENSCGVCTHPGASSCAVWINAAFSHTMFACNSSEGYSVFSNNYATLRSDISVYTAVQIVYSTITAAANPSSGDEVVTVRVTGTSAADTNKPSGLSHAGSAKAVGISIGVVAACGIITLGAWWAYRRHRNARENQDDTSQQSSGGGPHKDADIHELDNTSRYEAPDNTEVQNPHSPCRSELDAAPQPTELASKEISMASMTDTASSAPISPLDASLTPPPSGLRSPVSPLESPAVEVEDFPAGRYGPGGFLNPEYALRDGLWHDADRRQVLA